MQKGVNSMHNSNFLFNIAGVSNNKLNFRYRMQQMVDKSCQARVKMGQTMCIIYTKVKIFKKFITHLE
jgi:hypothetical protein